MIVLKIDSQTKLFGLLGHPVSHSHSPQIHNPKFEEYGINAAYLAFDVAPEALKQAVAGFFTLGAEGANVTVPHKETIIPFLAEISEEARMIGAVNTLVRTDTGFRGENTDGRGFLRSLFLEQHFEPEDQQVVIFGAGGACRAIAVSLALEKARKITMVNRSKGRAEAISDLIHKETSCQSQVFCYEDRKEVQEAMAEADLLINTTTLGMSPDVGRMPDVDVSVIGRHHLVADIIYNPKETLFLQEAKKQGARTINGYGMLVHQASLSFYAWTGKE